MEVQLTHFFVQKNSLRLFERCNMKHYPAGNSHQKDATQWSKTIVRRMWSLKDSQLSLMGESVPGKARVSEKHRPAH